MIGSPRIALAALLLLAGFMPVLAQEADEEAEVRAAVQHYLIAHATGDGAHHEMVFHPEARLFWVRDDTLNTRTSAEYIAGSPGKPADDEDQRRREITMVDVTGDAAVAKVVLDYPSALFTDYMSLLKIGGEWRREQDVHGAAERVAPRPVIIPQRKPMRQRSTRTSEKPASASSAASSAERRARWWACSSRRYTRSRIRSSQRSAHQSVIATRPPGASTRRISERAAARFGQWWSALAETTRSKALARNGSATASASARSARGPSLARAAESMAWLRSAPARSAPGRIRETWRSRAPVPQPTSRIRPLAGGSARRSVSRALTSM